jgi:hypothetical protein
MGGGGVGEGKTHIKKEMLCIEIDHLIYSRKIFLRNPFTLLESQLN